MNHRLYVVHFADHRIKFGITGDIKRRMRTYVREGQRNRVGHLTWWACAPLAGLHARLMERVMRRALADNRMPGHLEWIEGGSEVFGWLVNQAEALRAAVGDESEEVKRDLPFAGSFGHVNLQGARQ